MVDPIPFSKSDRPTSGGIPPLVESIISAVKAFMPNLSANERQILLNELTSLIRPIPTPKGGEVLDFLARLLPEKKEWRVDEIKDEIASGGVEAEPKEIYNAISYLARRGYVTKIGYGRYIIAGGAEIQTTEDLGLEPTKDEKYDPN